MSYPGESDELERLTDDGGAEPFVRRSYELFFGASNIVADGTLWPDQPENTAFGVNDARGESLFLGPATLVSLRALSRNAVHPVEVTYQMVVDGANVGTTLTIPLNGTDGVATESVSVGAGWHRLRIAVITAGSATVARYSASVEIVER